MKQFTDDTVLITSFHHGDPHAEKTIFDTYFQPLCLFTDRITGNILQAEDIVAETFEKVMLRRKDFPTVSKLKSFLYQSVHNAAINYVIAEKRHNAAHSNIKYLTENDVQDDLQFHTEIMRAELLREIYNEMESLPARCGQIFKMIFVEELTTQQIADKLNINVQTVRTQKARAIELIKAALLKSNPRASLLIGASFSTIPVIKAIFN